MRHPLLAPDMMACINLLLFSMTRLAADEHVALCCCCWMAVEEVGPEVKSLQKGDRVAVASNISCGQCFECRRQLYIYCDT